MKKRMNKEDINLCGKCGYPVNIEANFCRRCGSKLKKTCNCWIKKGNYDCGQDSCPGYEMFHVLKSKPKKQQSLRKVNTKP